MGRDRRAGRNRVSARVLELLGMLQEVADKIDILEAKRKEAAVEKERIETALAKAEKKLEEKLAEEHSLDMERRKCELKLKEEKERQARMKGRVAEVKTGREYQAVLAETNALKLSIQSLEEELAKGLEAHGAVSRENAELKESIARIKADLATATESYDKAVSETENQITAHREEEKSMLSQLPQDVKGRYNLIRSRRGGTAVVEAKGEACTACFMRIPPQAYIEIVRRSIVMQCPNCHRILIPPKVMDAGPVIDLDD